MKSGVSAILPVLALFKSKLKVFSQIHGKLSAVSLCKTKQRHASKTQRHKINNPLLNKNSIGRAGSAGKSTGVLPEVLD